MSNTPYGLRSSKSIYSFSEKRKMKRCASWSFEDVTSNTPKLLKTDKENLPQENHGVIEKPLLLPKENLEVRLFQNVTNIPKEPPNAATAMSTPEKQTVQIKADPVTPSSNFNLLTSVAASLDYATNKSKDNPTSCIGIESTPVIFGIESFFKDSAQHTQIGRKEKSLALICEKFFLSYPPYPSEDREIIISLDEAAFRLGVERRRIYDIVNVLESVEIIAKKAKNQYQWFGKNNLISSLLKLKALAIKENIGKKLETTIKCDNPYISGNNSSCGSSSQNKEKSCNLNASIVCDGEHQQVFKRFGPNSRKEKSLGMMSQKFLKLFLASTVPRTISLDLAAAILFGYISETQKENVQFKTKIRRLYDIANILSSIGLIEKVYILESRSRKPAFKYSGPNLETSHDDTVNKDKFEKMNQHCLIKMDVSKLTTTVDSKATFPRTKSENWGSQLNQKKTAKTLIRHSSLQDICAVAEIEREKLYAANSRENGDRSSFCTHASSSVSENQENSLSNVTASMDFNKNSNDSIGLVAASEDGVTNVSLATEKVPSFCIQRFPQNELLPKSCFRKTEVTSILKTPKSGPMPKVVLRSSSTLPVYTLVSKENFKDNQSNKKVQPVEKASKSEKVINLTPEQRDAILRSLNMSLADGQVASIRLSGGNTIPTPKTSFQDDTLEIIPGNMDAPLKNVKCKSNIGKDSDVVYHQLDQPVGSQQKIFYMLEHKVPANNNSEQLQNVDGETLIVYTDSQNASNVSSINDTQTHILNTDTPLISPFSIPSGYATPSISHITTPILPSNQVVTEVLNKIEQDGKNVQTMQSVSQNSFEYQENCLKNSAEENVSSTSVEFTSMRSSGTKWQSTSICSPLSFSDGSSSSANLEIESIMKCDNLGKSKTTAVCNNDKAYLFDEKTISSPIKQNHQTISNVISVKGKLISDSFFVNARSVFKPIYATSQLLSPNYFRNGTPVFSFLTPGVSSRPTSAETSRTPPVIPGLPTPPQSATYKDHDVSRKSLISPNIILVNQQEFQNNVARKLSMPNDL